MAGSFTVNGNGTVTLAFTYTVTTNQATTTLENVVRELYDRDLPVIERTVDPDSLEHVKVPYETLTNQDKVDILDYYLKRIIVDMAKSKDLKNKAEAASVPDPDITLE